MQQKQPAFPCDEMHGDGEMVTKRHLGLTKRELAALFAMAGIVASPDTTELSFDDVARRAWKQADAMFSGTEG